MFHCNPAQEPHQHHRHHHPLHLKGYSSCRLALDLTTAQLQQQHASLEIHKGAEDLGFDIKWVQGLCLHVRLCVDFNGNSWVLGDAWHNHSLLHYSVHVDLD